MTLGVNNFLDFTRIPATGKLAEDGTGCRLERPQSIDVWILYTYSARRCGFA